MPRFFFMAWVLSGCSGGKGGEQEIPDLPGLPDAAGSGGSADPLLGVGAVVDREMAPPEAVIAPQVVTLVGRLEPEGCLHGVGVDRHASRGTI